MDFGKVPWCGHLRVILLCLAASTDNQGMQCGIHLVPYVFTFANGKRMDGYSSVPTKIKTVFNDFNLVRVKS